MKSLTEDLILGNLVNIFKNKDKTAKILTIGPYRNYHKLLLYLDRTRFQKIIGRLDIIGFITLLGLIRVKSTIKYLNLIKKKFNSKSIYE